MKLPCPRGPLSAQLFAALADAQEPDPRLRPADEDDHQIALWVLYELHYRGFDEVPDGREWDPALIDLRRGLEESFEADVRLLADPLTTAARAESGDLAGQLERIVGEPGPAQAAYLHRRATREQFLEFLMLKSIYQLKEADPHAWALPRVGGAAKVALAELLYDEYGAGRPEALHQKLFADALRDAGLDDSYGAYVDHAPAETLAVNNLMSMVGLNRRLRGACLGHLAAFEMTSSLPSRRFAQGADRLGIGAGAIRYFDEHVEADAVHEILAVRSICASFVAAEPALHDDVLLGAAACVLLDARVAASSLDAWHSGGSALRAPRRENVA